MKTTEIVGYKREDLGTKYSRDLRADGNVPCVVYGAKENIHFHAPMYLFKELLYTPDAYFVNLNIQGEKKTVILKAATFHPVSEMILHVDFFEFNENSPLVMEIPVKIEGTSPGVQVGGQLYVKAKKLKVKALAKDMPEVVKVNVSKLNLGKGLKVKELAVQNFEILTNPDVSICSVIIPRALKAAGLKDQDAAAGAKKK